MLLIHIYTLYRWFIDITIHYVSYECVFMVKTVIDCLLLIHLTRELLCVVQWMCLVTAGANTVTVDVCVVSDYWS